MDFSGKNFVVTGAGSGIGREVAFALLKRGARVAAVDLHDYSLEETAKLAQAGNDLTCHVADVSDRATVNALPDAVTAQLGAPDGVIHCAGIIQPFVNVADLDIKTIERVIEVNLMGTIYVAQAFLPALSSRPEAHLCNVSSMGGFIPFPGQTVYSASKAAVKLLSEGLYAELLDSNVSVSVVMPGAVATNIVENSGIKAPDMDAGDYPAVPAPDAARIILDGIEAGKLHILVGKDAKSLNLFSRMAPARAIRMIQKKMKDLAG